MTDKEAKEAKRECLERLRVALPRYEARLRAVDDRLWTYARDVVREDVDVHCLDECLQLYAFLRKCDTYEMDAKWVRFLIERFEGVWKHDGDVWRHVEGGLKFDSIYGYRHYRLTESQVYMLAGIYGFKTWKNTTSKAGTRELMETEEAREDGYIWDHRRLTTSYVAMIPRKYGKTFIGGFIQFEGLMLEDRDYEGYVCANNQKQSGILFDMVKQMVKQLDPQGKRFRYTQTVIEWKDGQPRKGRVEALTAGGKTKDGLKAQYCSADEFGAAQRVKDHCDMEGLVNVVEGSMGPRREPLTVHTSTAGMGNETPYEILIRQYTADLLEELRTPLDGNGKKRRNDWRAGLILRPDQWEYDDRYLRKERVIRKVNPHLGTTVQADFYESEWKKADQQGEMKRKEVVTKLYNIFQSGKKVDWVTPDEVRRLQVERRIDDCTSEEGWRVFVGMDFSMGNDLHAVSYLAFRDDEYGGTEFFADMDAWISGATLETTSIKALYEKWISDGWLHVSPGAVLQPELPVDRIAELYEKGVEFLGFGYDPYKAKTPINALGAWLVGVSGSVSAPKDYIVPVRQNYASYNPVVEELDYMIKNDPPLLSFSANPLWPYEAGCAVLDVSADGMENKKIVKQNQSDACKVDNLQCLASALMLFDRADGKVVD